MLCLQGLKQSLRVLDLERNNVAVADVLGVLHCLEVLKLSQNRLVLRRSLWWCCGDRLTVNAPRQTGDYPGVPLWPG
jgi:hypothetical protein